MEWISVKDRLPELYEVNGEDFKLSAPVLVYDGELCVGFYEDDGEDDRKGFIDQYGSWLKGTHWMPLPEPPEEEDD